jgi:hypothetical protein
MKIVFFALSIFFMAMMVISANAGDVAQTIANAALVISSDLWMLFGTRRESL